MAEVFSLDDGAPSEASAKRAPSSTTATPPPEAAGEDHELQHHLPNEDIAVQRRVVPLLEFSEDTCSICLDDYTKEDPGAPTVCGHHFHLQCIMQWAQRSRECPLCFRGLALEDEDMNALLPFGEYVSPEQRAAEQATLETWELERLLLRLAAASQREHARAHRSARRASASAAGGGGGSGRHRRQGSRGEASAPQPIRSSGDAAAALGGSHGWLIAGEAASSSSSSAAGRPASAPPPGYPSPSSWQHVGGEPEPGSSGRGMVDEGHVVSPTARSGSFSLKSRLASLRLKDKFMESTKELRSLFSPGSHGSHGGASGPSGSSVAPH